MTNKSYLSNLQILRGLAAMNVVVFHSIGSARSYDMPPNVLSFLAGWGMNGVDLFFVLSGFVMVYTQIGRSMSPMDFITNRIIRIVPLYWALTVLILAILFGLPSAFQETTFDLDRAFASFLFLSTALLDTHPFPYLVVGWTLELEMLFYSIFALSLLMQHSNFSLFALASVLVALVSFAGTNPIVFEFLLGAVVALLVQNSRIPRWVGWLALTGGTLLFISTIWIDPVGPRWVYWGIPAAFIVLGAAVLQNLRWKLAELLGDASYSIYLIQVFSIPFIFKLLQVSGYDRINGDLAVLIATLVTGCAGIVTYYILERPLITVCRGLVRRRQPAG